MSAGPNAKPLGKEGWEGSGGKPIAPEDAEKELPTFTCQDEGCQYQGSAIELLVEDDNTTMYCPQCGTAGWIWD